jgi:hypothetical protein
MPFNPATIKPLRDELNKLIAAFAKKHSLHADLSQGSYTPDDLRFRLTLSRLGRDGKPPAQAKFELAARQYGLEPSDFEKTFAMDDRGPYRITGIEPSRPTYPISAVHVRTGKEYKFRIGDVLRALGRAIPDSLIFTRVRSGRYPHETPPELA